jgi:hypothetical protein
MTDSHRAVLWSVGCAILSTSPALADLPDGPPCHESFECFGYPQQYNFCLKEAGDCNGEGVCYRTGDACIALFDPVCGCDGMTYGNGCEAVVSGHTNVAKTDEDGDWVVCHDNCPHVYNRDQADSDGDGVGDACETSVSVVGWRSVREHGQLGPLAVSFDSSWAPGSPQPANIETRKGGVLLLEVDFSGPVTVRQYVNGVRIRYRTSDTGPTGGVSPWHTDNVDADTVAIALHPGVGLIPDRSLARVMLTYELLNQNLEGDRDVLIGSLAGDTDRNGVLDLSDALLTKREICLGTSVESQPHHDVNVNGLLNLCDVLLIRSMIATPLARIPTTPP